MWRARLAQNDTEIQTINTKITGVAFVLPSYRMRSNFRKRWFRLFFSFSFFFFFFSSLLCLFVNF